MGQKSNREKLNFCTPIIRGNMRIEILGKRMNLTAAKELTF